MSPIDMKRPRVTPAAPDLDIESLTIQVLENGFEVSCQPKQKESEDGSSSIGPWSPGKRYAFSSWKDARTFIDRKMSGADTDDYAGEDIEAKK